MTEKNPADGFDLHGMSVQDGVAGLDMSARTEEAKEVLLRIASSMGHMLDEAQAPNYLELEVSTAGGKHQYIMVLQRAGKITPHLARVAAETERDNLAAVISEARVLLAVGDAPGALATLHSIPQ